MDDYVDIIATVDWIIEELHDSQWNEFSSKVSNYLDAKK